MTPIPFLTRWVRRTVFSTHSYTVGKTYKIENWMNEKVLVVRNNSGYKKATSLQFWEIDGYMENLERHILN